MKTLLDGYGPFTTVYLVFKKKSRESLIIRRGVLLNNARQVQLDYLTQELVFLGGQTPRYCKCWCMNLDCHVTKST
jgi:hypothetical protein